MYNCLSSWQFEQISVHASQAIYGRWQIRICSLKFFCSNTHWPSPVDNLYVIRVRRKYPRVHKLQKEKQGCKFVQLLSEIIHRSVGHTILKQLKYHPPSCHDQRHNSPLWEIIYLYLFLLNHFSFHPAKKYFMCVFYCMSVSQKYAAINAYENLHNTPAFGFYDRALIPTSDCIHNSLALVGMVPSFH